MGDGVRSDLGGPEALFGERSGCPSERSGVVNDTRGVLFFDLSLRAACGSKSLSSDVSVLDLAAKASQESSNGRLDSVRRVE